MWGARQGSQMASEKTWDGRETHSALSAADIMTAAAWLNGAFALGE
jgi:hypothetical protein